MTSRQKQVACNLCAAPIMVRGIEQPNGDIIWQEICPICGNSRMVTEVAKKGPSATFGDKPAPVTVSPKRQRKR